jgi:spore coat protein H
MDDSVYQEKHRQYLQETIENVFQPEALAERYQEAHNLIAPYMEREVDRYPQLDSLESFELSVDELSRHAQERYEAVLEYLETE